MNETFDISSERWILIGHTSRIAKDRNIETVPESSPHLSGPTSILKQNFRFHNQISQERHDYKLQICVRAFLLKSFPCMY